MLVLLSKKNIYIINQYIRKKLIMQLGLKDDEEKQSRTLYKELSNNTLILLFIIAIATAPSYKFSGTPSLGDMAFLKNRF